MAAAGGPEKLLCTCTKRLLRFSDEGVELLCRYCKRVTLARFDELASPAGLRRLGRRLLQAGRRETRTWRIHRCLKEWTLTPAHRPAQSAKHVGRGIEARGPRSSSKSAGVDVAIKGLAASIPDDRSRAARARDADVREALLGAEAERLNGPASSPGVCPSGPRSTATSRRFQTFRRSPASSICVTLDLDGISRYSCSGRAAVAPIAR